MIFYVKKRPEERPVKWSKIATCRGKDKEIVVRGWSPTRFRRDAEAEA
jgi:hypothetical protein